MACSLLEPSQPATPSLWARCGPPAPQGGPGGEEPGGFFTHTESKSTWKTSASKPLSAEKLRPEKRKMDDLAIENEVLEELLKDTKPELDMEVPVPEQEGAVHSRKVPRLDTETKGSPDDRAVPESHTLPVSNIFNEKYCK